MEGRMALAAPSDATFGAAATRLQDPLSLFTPGDVCGSEALKSVFGGWWKSGTKQDRIKLLQMWLAEAGAECAAPRPVARLAIPEPRPTKASKKKLITAPEDQIESLVHHLAKGTLVVPELYPEDGAQIDPLTRMKTIAALDHNVKRLNILYFAHTVDSYRSSKKLGPGETTVSQALDALSGGSKDVRAEATTRYDRRPNYYVLANTCDLGVLFTTGAVSAIENLSRRDAVFLCDYLKKQHEEYLKQKKEREIAKKDSNDLISDIISRSETLSRLAAKAIIYDLVHYGWTMRELAESKSNLMGLVFNHLERESLKHGIVRDTVAKGDFKVEIKIKDERKRLAGNEMASGGPKRARKSMKKRVGTAIIPNTDHNAIATPGSVRFESPRIDATFTSIQGVVGSADMPHPRDSRTLQNKQILPSPILHCPTVDAQSDCLSSMGAGSNGEQVGCRTYPLRGERDNTYFGHPQSTQESRAALQQLPSYLSTTSPQIHSHGQADLLPLVSLQDDESRWIHPTGRAALHPGESPDGEMRPPQHNELSQDYDPPDTDSTPGNEPRQEGLTTHALESCDPDRPSRYANDFTDDEGYDLTFNAFINMHQSSPSP
ncbi:hypothetical protein PMIN06_010474 [Paraphaeosphaeria minitans]